MGAALHAFGDSYSHRVIGDEKKMYKSGVGHAKHFTTPDKVETRPQLYKQYALDLFDTLAEKADKQKKTYR